MNPVVLQVKFSARNKEQAIRLLQLLQSVSNGTTVHGELVKFLQDDVIVIEGTIRERRENE